MGTRRGHVRPRHLCRPVWGADTHPVRHMPDLALEWGGADFARPPDPRFPKRLALVLLIAALLLSLFLPLACALTGCQARQTQEPPRPVYPH